MDVLIIDECGQLSADQLATLDIILHTARKNHIPFGGVLVFGTMDHTQLGAINGWPFLLSSHILTDFTLVKLTHSVRAFGDEKFQRLQDLTRMSPKDLLKDPRLEKEFKKLCGEIFEFVKDWESDKIDQFMQRMYAKRMPAYEASLQFVQSTEKIFLANGTKHTVKYATNLQKYAGTRGEYTTLINKDMLNALNKELREPEKLLFFEGAQY